MTAHRREETTVSDPNKPSQAEGDDPSRPDEGEVLAEEGHPSQAEGGDPDDPNPTLEVGDGD
jgi:hypothetical protein